MKNIMQNPLVNLVKQYFNNVTLKQFDQAELDEIVALNMARFDTTICGDIDLYGDLAGKSELEKAEYLLQGCNLLWYLKLGGIKQVNLRPTITNQDLLAEYAKVLHEGYTPVPTTQRTYSKFEKLHKGFIVNLPTTAKVEAEQILKVEAEKLLRRRNELINETLLNVDKAKNWAQRELAQQQKDEQAQMEAMAIAAAEKLKESFKNE
ncbi:hypothetical protein AAEO70_003470 [Vibrio cholerae]